MYSIDWWSNVLQTLGMLVDMFAVFKIYKLKFSNVTKIDDRTIEANISTELNATWGGEPDLNKRTKLLIKNIVYEVNKRIMIFSKEYQANNKKAGFWFGILLIGFVIQFIGQVLPLFKDFIFYGHRLF